MALIQEYGLITRLTDMVVQSVVMVIGVMKIVQQFTRVDEKNAPHCKGKGWIPESDIELNSNQ